MTTDPAEIAFCHFVIVKGVRSFPYSQVMNRTWAFLPNQLVGWGWGWGWRQAPLKADHREPALCERGFTYAGPSGHEPLDLITREGNLHNASSTDGPLL